MYGQVKSWDWRIRASVTRDLDWGIDVPLKVKEKIIRVFDADWLYFIYERMGFARRKRLGTVLEDQETKLILWEGQYCFSLRYFSSDVERRKLYFG
jgi:hypothetical protein